MTIKSAEKADLEAIVRLEREIFTVPWSPEGFSAELESPYGEIYLAEETGEVAGFLVIHRFYEEAEIFNLAVSEKFRRRGIAEAMMKRAIAEAEEKGVSRFLLEVRQSNRPARELYKKQGFQVLGIRKNYYESPQEDAVIMERAVNS